MIDREIVLLAFEKFRELSERFDGFISVILDDWRGFRFIYDVMAADCCRYGCTRCPLYALLRDEEDGAFTAGLLPASEEDKVLFGPQNFLNCKSITQYQNCYTNFLVRRCFSKDEVFSELNLVKEMRIIYSRFGAEEEQGLAFRRGVIRDAVTLSDVRKKELIREYIRLHPDFYDGEPVL